MNRPSFNVLTEPWIPVVRSTGSRDKLGILSCLQQAHELREIRDPSPIVEFGIYRLLVAFVLDALILADRRPEHPLDLKAMINSGRFEMEMIEDYVAECGDVFDLFHPERPFLQENMPDAKSKALAGMYPAVPSGTNVSHWHHLNEDSLGVASSEAARLLTTISPFMTAGGAGLSPSINGAPAIYVLPCGRTLFQTITLNIPLRKQETGNGTVAWRSSRTAGEERTEATTVEALTWRPRRVQLIVEEGSYGNSSIRTMRFERGDSTRLSWIDSNLAYRFESAKVSPIRMREGRPVWRDAGPLLLMNDFEIGGRETKVAFRRPDAVAHAFAALEGQTNSLLVQIYGMRTDMKMKIFEWTRSELRIPCGLGHSTRLGWLVQSELDLAEKASRLLRGCIRALYPRGGAGNKQAMRSLADRSERAFWQRLEAPFDQLMVKISDLDEETADDPELVGTVVKPWRDTVRDLAVEQFDRAAKDMDSDAAALARLIRMRRKLIGTLNKLL